jgi:hypothetical protein
MATTRLSTGVSLAKKPQAPAWSASATSRSSDATVSASTRMSGLWLTISRVASGPVMSGMRRSMRMTSGFSSAARRTPIRPPDAWATTSMPSSSAMSEARPVRKRSWSSTMSTRVGAFTGVAMLASLCDELPTPICLVPWASIPEWLYPPDRMAGAPRLADRQGLPGQMRVRPRARRPRRDAPPARSRSPAARRRDPGTAGASTCRGRRPRCAGGHSRPGRRPPRG